METIVLPDVPEIIAPMIYALPIQMLAYYTAVFMGTDVDQPRNLANKSVKQIFETLFSQSGTSFRKVGLVEFPAKGMWSLVFISSPAQGRVAEGIPAQDEHLSVFLPCTPNPTTGFYFFLPARDIIEIPMTPDDAAKLIMSAGLIQPEGQAALAAMAEAAKRQGAAQPAAALNGPQP
jgi:uncharacterized membrane protein